MIRECVVAGLRKAKAQGKLLGRPKVVLSRYRMEQLYAQTKSWEQVAKRMGVSRSTLHRRLSQNPL